MADTQARPILFHYPGSPYAHRVLWYLWLCGIEYDECIQPPMLPRPDLSSLDVNYRRIPILSIGKDIYCDSRLMIKKLEQHFPSKALLPASAADAGTRKLLENWTVDGGIFANTVKLMPFWKSGGLLQNKHFVDDRAQLSGGRRMSPEAMAYGRPDGLVHMRQAFELLETTFLADGRNWILGTDAPTSADVDAVWPFEWLIMEPSMVDALDSQYISESHFPKTFAYVRRFMAEVEARKRTRAKPNSLSGAQVKDIILNSPFAETPSILSADPLSLSAGDPITVFPTDYGSSNKDTGVLVGLSTTEVVLRNTHGIHIHFPRWNFRIEKSQPAPLTPSPRTPPIQPHTLLYHPLSPFSRKVYLTALELALTPSLHLQKVVVCPVPFPGWSDNNPTVSAHNPLTKIPCLITPDNQPIFDSAVICEYLTHLAKQQPNTKDAAYFALKTLHALADGIMDAMVLLHYEARIRAPKKLAFLPWIEGQKEKINRGLDELERAVQKGVLKAPQEGKAVSADEIAVAVAVGALEGKEGLDWRSWRPGLEKWMKAWEGRRSWAESRVDRDWGVREKGEAKI
ncbi:hypothetical protein M011DRAFT_458323 [Sporormia fimetaria CBS 119925]|uniref:GST N-terminal domain-containing protein n=1 Tax=Sporormia fimetaria CBS 119925 TaxID=1340428 RepID=A0A6A6VE36_9PLEO|nr:hypothetical protein M011DRAFT_458323 [Sporormia fimetaria CBS 119925]